LWEWIGEGVFGDKVVEVRDLVKRFGNLVALKGVSFSVGRGEFFGLIGPNGAASYSSLNQDRKRHPQLNQH